MNVPILPTSSRSRVAGKAPRWRTLLLLVVVFGASIAHGQTPTPANAPASTPAAAATPAPTPATPTPTPSVPIVNLGEELHLPFDNLETVLLKCGKKGLANPADLKLTLLLDGRDMKLAPQWDFHGQSLRFRLDRTPENEAQWRALFLRRWQDARRAVDQPAPPGTKTTPAPGAASEATAAPGHQFVRVTVAAADNPKLVVTGKVSEVQLRYYTEGGSQKRWAVGISVFLLSLLTWAGLQTNLLRDSLPPELDLAALGLTGKRPTYSLGRVQMACWLWLITSAFLGLWVVLGARDSLNQTALTLLGISLGTGVLARGVEVGKTATIGKLYQEWTELQALGPQATTAQTARLAILLRQLQTAVPSKNFVADIVSDDSGATVPRVQMVIWTLVLALIFITEAFKTLSMPTFDDTLLFLMGISNAAYVGFKIPEKPVA